ncbi:unnamed protein product [marine sediment metagenome]|uniref:Uncharacterized protein n=1 Tax=marine sediment metagenome TaxID=412755 RepID=X0ZG04_9ZZZZ
MADLNIFDLKGKTAVITGGAGILGSSIALGLAGAGARVAICDIANYSQLVPEVFI